MQFTIPTNTLRAFAEVCASKKNESERLKNIHIANGVIEATDSYVYAYRFENLPLLGDSEYFIPATIAKTLRPNRMATIVDDGGCRTINDGDVLFMLPTVEKAYPNLKNMRAQDDCAKGGSLRIGSEYLEKVVRFTKKFAPGRWLKLKFTLLQGGIGEITPITDDFAIRFIGK